jgi:hypothetical protein
MRITETLLRKIIREVLLPESVSPTATAAAMGMAVCLTKGYVIIYDPKILISAIENVQDLEEIPGVIESTLEDEPVVRAGVRYSHSSAGGPCNRSGIVMQSASWEGSRMGPAAYEAAMWYAGGLASDREETSRSAGRVWKRYKNRAEDGELESIPFDNIEDPKTPPIEDDCVMQDKLWLNSSYRLWEKPEGLAEMEARHHAAISQISDLGYSINRLEPALRSQFSSIFDWRLGDDD